jgi:hypothetical protein
MCAMRIARIALAVGQGATASHCQGRAFRAYDGTMKEQAARPAIIASQTDSLGPDFELGNQSRPVVWGRAGRKTSSLLLKNQRGRINRPLWSSLLAWLRGPATTCRQTGPWRSSSISWSKSAFNPVTFSPVLSSPSETTNLATGGSDQTRCWSKRRYTSAEYGPATTERAAHVLTARRLLCGRPERRCRASPPR